MDINMLKHIKHYLFYPRFHFNRFQFNLVVVFLLTIGFIAGSYLTLSKIFPNVFALNDTHQTWTFSTANAGTYTYDSTLVTVDDTGAHPLVNKLINPSFASDNSSWSTAAVAPSGWVEVPADSNFGTSNFLAMKYEAKCAATSDPATGLTSPDSGYNTYSDSGTPCTSANSKQVVSVASGYPIANISHTNALTRCSAVSINGSATHLITNDEWMTIARNAEAQAGNWSLGSVGSGYLFAGHNDNSPAKARPASTTDTGNNRCAYTDSAGTTEAPATCPSNTAAGTSGNTENQVRTFTMSNGAVIWDISGNVWELVQRSTNNSGDDTTVMNPLPACTDNVAGWGWCQYGSTTTPYVSAWTSSVVRNKVGPLSTAYNSSQGMGQVYTYKNGTQQSTTVFLRGARWSNSSYAGAFTVDLTRTASNTDSSVGFRCASDPVAISQSFSSSSGRAGGGDTITIGAISDGKIYQSVNVGDTSSYDFSAYVYNINPDKGTVDITVAQLYYNGAVITTNYTETPSGSGWYKLTGTLTGANASREYGVLVKAGKTVKVDDLTLNKAGTYSVYNTSAYSNAQVNTWDTFCEGTLVGSTCTTDFTYSGNSAIKYQICTDDGSACQTGSSWKYWDGSHWQTASNTTTHVNTAAQLTQAAMQALPIVSQKISVKTIFTFGGSDLPNLPHISIGFTTDTTVPTTNASSIAMSRSNGGTAMSSNGWAKSDSPYFSWTAGADNAGGSGVKGYCLSLSLDNNEDGIPDNDPATAKGLLGTSPVSTAGTTCLFMVTGTSIDFATASYKGAPWLVTSNKPYLFAVKVVDNSGNIYAGNAATFQFRFDNTTPTNTSYISCASGNFSNVADMNFSWPTSGSAASLDSNAGVLGWQYQINSTSGTWLGTTTESILGVTNYIQATASGRTLAQDQDGSSIVSGNNIVYFRTVDIAGNISADSTIRTCNLSYGGAAPSFNGTDTVTVTPSTSTSNSYALSWPVATATNSKTVTHYYYMINTSPPSTLATLQGNAATYIDNGTSRTVAASALPGVNKGSNTVYVVAIDNASTPNYSPSNYITGTFTLNSTDPDNVENLVSSDSSIKSQSQWNVTLTWTAPTYKGAGNLTYLVYRSTDGTTFSQVGSTSGLSYVDNAPSSAKYYYKIYSKDGALAQSSGTNAVFITPTGKWTSAPSLDSGPTVGGITTKKATITWTTSRTSDSKVQYGTTSGSYGDVEPSNSSQVSSHSIQLTGLNPGTTYYYKVKWTDEDGNTGSSDKKSFSTASAPTVKDVSAKNIGLSSAIIQFTSNNASKVKIYYGLTTGFGGAKETSTSTSETTYTSELIGLADGTKYYYKINTFDSEASEYEGTILDFTTLPRPKISNVRIQQVANTSQSTILVTWSTNTEVSSITTYYPEGKSDEARDEVNVALTKGEHRMIIRGLQPQTPYILMIKGRDKVGNEAVSDIQKLTTATDTRPPQISELHVEGSAIPPTASTAQESMSQLIVSWNTDEPATSQVEFGEGTGVTYSSKTQEDSNLTYNHIVIISNLTPSKVYHLRTISKDKAGNTGNSIDTVTITPKATENALNLVISNLQEAFGFIGGLRQ